MNQSIRHARRFHVRPEEREKAQAAFDARYTVRDNGCWEWTGSDNGNGYGRMIMGSRKLGTRREMYAHAIAYELLVGRVPDGMVIDHLCRNRLCVNPAHLEVVTNEENIRRGEWAPLTLAQRDKCSHGHPFSAENTAYSSDGARVCRTCYRHSQRLSYWAKKGRQPVECGAQTKYRGLCRRRTTDPSGRCYEHRQSESERAA